MFYLQSDRSRCFDHLDEAIEVAEATGDNVIEKHVVNGCIQSSLLVWQCTKEEFAQSVKENPRAFDGIKFVPSKGQALFNAQTLFYEADRLWEVAAIRGVISFDDFAKFYRRLIPLLEELGISLDPDDERKARLEAEG